MRTSKIVTAALFAALPAMSRGQHDHLQHSGAQGAQMAGQTLEQVTCPVTGKPVNERVTARIEGKEIKFCCDRCIGMYEADPDKYAPGLYKQIYPQRVQVKCPVMGGPVDPDVYIEHQGEKIHFCCQGCDGKFEQDPARYAAGLKAAYTEQVHCPVTGKPIDPQHRTKTAGGEVYFCSSECIKPFKAQPQKYSAAVLPAAGLLARGATAGEDLVRCPVCPPDNVHQRSEVQTVAHGGKAHFLSSDACARKFRAGPAKYLQAAPERPTTPARGGCCPH